MSEENKELSDREERFCRIYTDKSNPETFMRPVAAYHAAFPGVKHSTARANTSKIRKRERVRNRIQEILDEMNWGVEQRLDEARQIGQGYASYTEQRITKNGEIVEIEVKPNYSERLRALEMANRMDGSYAQVQAQKEIAVEEHKSLQKQILNDLVGGKKTKNVTPSEHESEDPAPEEDPPQE